ncbi:MAG TPA: head-tail connector protein [Rhizobiaceae bacterium]|nr:head-tail connector protein [Rhizobiaceae bacterium]
MLAPVLVTPPAVPLWTAEEAIARLHLLVDSTDDNALIDHYIEAATAHLDGYSGILGRALVTQTWRIDASAWGFPFIRLPLAPVQSVTVKYFDGANIEQTLAADQYEFFSDALGPRIARAPSASWPSLYARSDAVRVTFIAGYGGAATDVPASIRQAVLMLAAHWYTNREAVAEQGMASIPMGVDALIAPYRRHWL